MLTRWSVAGVVLCCFLGGIQAQNSDFGPALGNPGVSDFTNTNVCATGYCGDYSSQTQVFDSSGLTPSLSQSFNVPVSNGTLTNQQVTLSPGLSVSSLDTPVAVADSVANAIPVVVDVSALPKQVGAFLEAFPNATGNVGLGLSLIEYAQAYSGEARKAEDAQIGLSTNVGLYGLGLAAAALDAPLAALVFSETGLFLQASGSAESQSPNFYVAPDPAPLYPPIPPMPDAGSQVFVQTAPLSAPFTFGNPANSVIVDPVSSPGSYNGFNSSGNDINVGQTGPGVSSPLLSQTSQAGFGGLVPYLQFVQLGAAINSLTTPHTISQPSLQSIQQPLWWSGVNLSQSPSIAFNPFFNPSTKAGQPAQPTNRTAQGASGGVDYSCPSWFDAWQRAVALCDQPPSHTQQSMAQAQVGSSTPAPSAGAGRAGGGVASSGIATFSRPSAARTSSGAAEGSLKTLPSATRSLAPVDTEPGVIEQKVSATGAGVAMFSPVAGDGLTAKPSPSLEPQGQAVGVAVFVRKPLGTNSAGVPPQNSGVAVFARDPNRMGAQGVLAVPVGGVAADHEYLPNSYNSVTGRLPATGGESPSPRSVTAPSSKPVAKPVTVSPRPAPVYHK
jgi:hypothetical protein